MKIQNSGKMKKQWSPCMEHAEVKHVSHGLLLSVFDDIWEGQETTVFSGTLMWLKEQGPYGRAVLTSWCFGGYEAHGSQLCFAITWRIKLGQLKCFVDICPPFGWNCHHAAGMTGQVTKCVPKCLWHSVHWQLNLGQLYYGGWSSKLQHVRNCFTTSLDIFAVERVFIPRGEKEAATSGVPCRHLIFHLHPGLDVADCNIKGFLYKWLLVGLGCVYVQVSQSQRYQAQEQVILAWVRVLWFTWLSENWCQGPMSDKLLQISTDVVDTHVHCKILSLSLVRAVFWTISTLKWLRSYEC